MLGKLIIFALLGVCCASIFGSLKNEAKKFSPVKNVEHFSVGLQDLRDKVHDKITPWGQSSARGLFSKLQSALLLHGAPLNAFGAGQAPPYYGNSQDSVSPSHERLKLGSYSIQNCSTPSPDKAKFIIKSLTISPDPVELPGTLTIGFDVDLLEDIPSDEVILDMEFKRGSTTVKIPCLGSIGSCDYKNVCDYLSTIPACPQEFVAAKIPCKCPFNKGSYKLPKIEAEVDASVFLKGDYTLTARSVSDGQINGCYIITFTISSD